MHFIIYRGSFFYFLRLPIYTDVIYIIANAFKGHKREIVLVAWYLLNIVYHITQSSYE